MQQSLRIIRLIGFQGAGRKNPQYLSENPLILFGHIGIQFQDNPTIYGFHPTAEAVNTVGGLDGFLKLMRLRTPIPGIFQDDSAIFLRAFELTPLRPPDLVADNRLRLVVYALNLRFELQQYSQIQTKLESWYNLKKELPYLLAPIAETDSFDNCATVQRHLGIPVPAFAEHEGQLGLYMLLFAREGEYWKPE